MSCAAQGWASGAALEVWFDERVPLGSAVRQSLCEEAQALLGKQRLALRFSSESAMPVQPDVMVTLRATPPPRYPDALGLAVRRGDRVEPVLEIYIQPLIRLFKGAVGQRELGRAIARILVHEMIHYSTQRIDHDASGVFASGLGVRELSLDSASFRKLAH